MGEHRQHTWQHGRLAVFLHRCLSFSTAASVGCGGAFTYQSGDWCYAYIGVNKTWSDAQNTCEKVGGYLAEPKTKTQNDFLEKILFEHRGYTIWLGAHDEVKEGEWIWEYSRGRVDRGFTFWSPGEPNDSKAAEDCLEFQYDFGHWNDKYCNLTQHFVCQKSAVDPAVVVG